MIKGLVGAYYIDTTQGDYKALKRVIPKNLRLILSKDGNYSFRPQLDILKGYNGTWDLSDDAEYGNYVFNCANGDKQTNGTMFISFQINKEWYEIYFGDKEK